MNWLEEMMSIFLVAGVGAAVCGFATYIFLQIKDYIKNKLLHRVGKD